MTRVGIIGLSESNGHPFSFSAIVNGYDPVAFRKAGWPVILDYLELRPKDDFGLPDLQITHAWTQDRATTDRLCAACRIEHPVDDFRSMLGNIDALIIARDDWNTHMGFAKPYLDREIPVFVDKPLSLNPAELEYFAPHLYAGKLMSSAGLRYAAELDAIRSEWQSLGSMRLITATVLNDLEHYGIHMLDALSGLGLSPVRAVSRLAAAHESYALTLTDGLQVLLNCIGSAGKTFHLSFFGSKAHRHCDLHDNFSAFRRMLDAFRRMLATGQPQIDPKNVLATMQLISAARRLAPGESWEIDSGSAV